jgi:DNA ligase (NAD+)
MILFFVLFTLISSSDIHASSRFVSLSFLKQNPQMVEQIRNPNFLFSHVRIKNFFTKFGQSNANPILYSNDNPLSGSFESFSECWYPFLFYFCNPQCLKNTPEGFPERVNEQRFVSKRKRQHLSFLEYSYIPHHIGFSTLTQWLKKRNEYVQRSLINERETDVSRYQFDLFDRKLYAIIDQMDEPTLVSKKNELESVVKNPSIAMSPYELSLYFMNVDNTLGKNEDRLYVCYPDISGLSISLSYDRGILVKAQVDDFGKSYDVLDIVRQDRRIPKLINKDGYFTVDGKIYLTLKDLNLINLQRYEQGLRPWIEGALCISAALKDQDHQNGEIIQRLSYSFDEAYDREKKEFSNYQSMINFLSQEGFSVLNSSHFFKGTVAFVYPWMSNHQEFYHFETRGKKVRLFDYREESLVKFYSSAILLAKPDIVSTSIKSIRFQVLSNGRVVACVNVNPLVFNRKEYSHFFINNLTKFEELNLHDGDDVQIVCFPNKKPYLYRSFANGSGKPYIFPSSCPKCKSVLHEEHFEGDVSLRCGAHLVCTDMVESDSIRQFISFSGFNIQSLTPSIIEELTSSSVLIDPSDIFDLFLIDLQSLKEQNKDQFNKILSDIEKAKRIKLGNFLYALSIPSLTSLMANGLAHTLGTLENVKRVTKAQLKELSFLDEKSIEGILKFFKDPHNIRFIAKLLSKGITITEYSDPLLSLCYKDKKLITPQEYKDMVDSLDIPQVTSHRLDQDYDLLVDTVKEIEKLHPGWKQKKSLQSKPAEKTKVIEDFIKIKKTYDKETLRKMLLDYGQFSKISVLPKINGVACFLVFQDGVLLDAYTKGSQGSKLDIKKLIQQLPSIPNELESLSGILRGELFLLRDGLKKINEERERSGLSPYVDGLSAVVSALNKSNLDHTLGDNLQFFGFGFAGFEGIEEKLLDDEAVADLFKRNHIGYTKFYPKSFTDLEDALSYCTDSFSRRFETEMDLDGMVIRLQKDKDADILRYAYKFDIEKKDTKVLGISFSLSHSGRLTIIADIEPLTFNNARTVKRIYVEDHTLFDKNAIGIGDIVSVQFMGGVKASIVGLKSGKSKDPLIIPKDCPNCLKKLNINRSGNRMCLNKLCQRETIASDVLKFMRLLGVLRNDDELTRVIQIVMNAGLIKNKKDLFLLDIETLRDTCRLSAEQVSMFLRVIEHIKTLSPLQIISAVKESKGDRENNIEKVLALCNNPADLFSLSTEYLVQNSINPSFSKVFINFLKKNKDDLEEIFKHLIIPVLGPDLPIFSMEKIQKELEAESGILNDMMEKNLTKLAHYVDKIDESITIISCQRGGQDFKQRKDLVRFLRKKQIDVRRLMNPIDNYLKGGGLTKDGYLTKR